jgi:hypothetical protein
VSQKTKSFGPSEDLGEGTLGAFLGKASEAKAGLMPTVQGLELGMITGCRFSKSGIVFDLNWRF